MLTFILDGMIILLTNAAGEPKSTTFDFFELLVGRKFDPLNVRLADGGILASAVCDLLPLKRGVSTSSVGLRVVQPSASCSALVF